MQSEKIDGSFKGCESVEIYTCLHRFTGRGLVHTSMSKVLKKYPDCRIDLTGGGGYTDVCPGRQTPSRRHYDQSEPPH